MHKAYISDIKMIRANLFALLAARPISVEFRKYLIHCFVFYKSRHALEPDKRKVVKSCAVEFKKIYWLRVYDERV